LISTFTSRFKLYAFDLHLILILVTVW